MRLQSLAEELLGSAADLLSGGERCQESHRIALWYRAASHDHHGYQKETSLPAPNAKPWSWEPRWILRYQRSGRSFRAWIQQKLALSSDPSHSINNREWMPTESRHLPLLIGIPGAYHGIPQPNNSGISESYNKMGCEYPETILVVHFGITIQVAKVPYHSLKTRLSRYPQPYLNENVSHSPSPA